MANMSTYTYGLDFKCASRTIVSVKCETVPEELILNVLVEFCTVLNRRSMMNEI